MRRDYAVTLAGQVSQAVASLIAVVVLARLLPPAQFGVAVLLTMAVTIAGIAVAAGAQAAVLVTSARRPAARPEIAGVNLALTAVVLAVAIPVALVASQPFATALSREANGSMVFVTAIRIVPTVYIGLVTASLTGAGRIGMAALLGLAGAAFSTLMPLGAWIAADRLLGALIGALVGNVATMAIGALLSRRGLGFASPRHATLWRELWSIGAPLHLGTVAYWLLLRTDAFILNAIVGGAEVGIYALALTLTERVSLVTSPLYNATAWRISGPDPAAALRTCLLIVQVMIAVGVAACVGAIVVGPFVVDLLAGPAYAAAAGLMPILVVGAALLPVWSALGLFLVSHQDGVWLTTVVQITVAVAAIAGYLVGIRAAGMIGAAVVSTLAYASLAVIALAAVRSRHAFSLARLIPTPASVRTMLAPADPRD